MFWGPSTANLSLVKRT